MGLLKTSVSAGVLIVSIVLLRAAFLHRLPKRTFSLLWGVALCRLWLPLSIPSRLSVFSLVDQVTCGWSPGALPWTEGALSLTGATMGQGAPALPPSVIPGAGNGEASPVFILLWLMGVAACALLFLIIHWRCRREYRSALPVDRDFVREWMGAHPLRRTLRIRQWDQLSAPLTYGILRPVILLPKQTDWDNEDQLRYILMHEIIHIRRWDTLGKLLMAAALCIHWFNPLVWLMYGLLNRDMELACDEAVLRSLGEAQKSAYASTLIGLEEKKSRLMPLVNYFGKNAMEERIVAIMKIRKPSVLGAALALALVVGTTTVFATGPLATHQDIGPVQEPHYLVGPLENEPDQNLEAANGLSFWEVDEFEAWMQEQRAQNQKLADRGDHFFYAKNADGDYAARPWTQADVEALYSQWQDQLERMKQGYRYTKVMELSDGGLLSGVFEPEAMDSRGP